jgi:hypothetical protein
MRSRTRLLATLLLGLAPLAFAADPDFYWYYYDVDSLDAPVASKGAFSRARAASDGTIKIAYRKQYTVHYAEFDGVRIAKRELADTGAYPGAKMTMDLDKNGHAFITYGDWADARLYSAHHDGTAWHHGFIDYLQNGGSVDFYGMSMIADGKGGYHQVNTKHKDGWNALIYHHLDSEGAVTDSGYPCDCGLSGKWNDVTMDPAGNPVIAYFKHSGNYAIVSWKEGSQWKSQPIDSVVDAHQGYHSVIAHDTGNTYYVASHDRLKGKLLVAHGTPGGEWAKEALDTLPGFTLFGTSLSLAEDSAHVPYLAYVHATVNGGDDTAQTSRLMLAYKKDTAWTKVAVDTTGIVGEFATLSLGRNGLPIITYLDRTRLRLRMAVAKATAPADTNHNGIPDYQEIPSGIKKRGRLQGALKAAAPARFDALGKRASGKSRPHGGRPLFREPKAE